MNDSTRQASRREAADETGDALRLDDQLCFALYAATNAVTRAYRPGLSSLGITYPQYLVCLVLWQDGPLTAGAIAARLKLGSNAISPLLDQLAAAGLVARHRETSDRRRVQVRLTEEGAALEAKAADVQHCVQDQTGLSPVDLRRLREKLIDLADRVATEADRQAESTPD